MGVGAFACLTSLGSSCTLPGPDVFLIVNCGFFGSVCRRVCFPSVQAAVILFGCVRNFPRIPCVTICYLRMSDCVSSVCWCSVCVAAIFCGCMCVVYLIPSDLWDFGVCVHVSRSPSVQDSCDPPWLCVCVCPIVTVLCVHMCLGPCACCCNSLPNPLYVPIIYL